MHYLRQPRGAQTSAFFLHAVENPYDRHPCGTCSGQLQNRCAGLKTFPPLENIAGATSENLIREIQPISLTLPVVHALQYTSFCRGPIALLVELDIAAHLVSLPEGSVHRRFPYIDV